jgi:hypothetical protein
MFSYIIEHLLNFLTLVLSFHAEVHVCKKRLFGYLLFKVVICTFNFINHSAIGNLAAHRKITSEINKRCDPTRSVMLEYSL